MAVSLTWSTGSDTGRVFSATSCTNWIYSTEIRLKAYLSELNNQTGSDILLNGFFTFFLISYIGLHIDLDKCYFNRSSWKIRLEEDLGEWRRKLLCKLETGEWWPDKVMWVAGSNLSHLRERDRLRLSSLSLTHTHKLTSTLFFLFY